jgi:predicted DNA-binding ribbon-helix-helix protein
MDKKQVKVRKDQINVSLEHEDWKKLKIVCLEKDVTVQAVIENFVKLYISKKGEIEDIK